MNSVLREIDELEAQARRDQREALSALGKSAKGVHREHPLATTLSAASAGWLAGRALRGSTELAKTAAAPLRLAAASLLARVLA